MKVRDMHGMRIRLSPEIIQWIRDKSKKEERSLNYTIAEALKKAKKTEEAA